MMNVLVNWDPDYLVVKEIHLKIVNQRYSDVKRISIKSSTTML